MEIKNIIVRAADGEFDYLLEGVQVKIYEVFEDAICYLDSAGAIVTRNCWFEGDAAVIEL